MKPEKLPTRQPNEILPNTGTHSLDRVDALGQVLRHFDLPFRVIATEGARYPDGNARVPRGAAFVTYDTGDIPTEVIWRMVDEIAPIPIVDGRR